MLTIVRRPLSPRFETISSRHGRTGFPSFSASVSARPRSLPTGGKRYTQDLLKRRSDVGVADRGRIVEACLERGPDGRHEVCGIGAAKTAMMALALQKGGIGYGHATKQRLIAARRFGAEIHDDGRRRRSRSTFEAHSAHRQRSRNRSEVITDEDTAGVVLRKQRLDHLPHQGLGVVPRQIDEIIASVGADHDIGFGRIGADRSAGAARILPGLVVDARSLSGGLMQRQAQERARDR